MHAHVVVELLVFLMWCAVMGGQWRRGTRAALGSIPVLVLPFSALSEIVNATVFAGFGTVYPASLLWFPGYRFPVAILLLMGLFAAAVDLAAGALAARLRLLAAGRMAAYGVFYALGIALCFGIEAFGTGIGYWQYQVVPTGFIMLAQLYVFYAAVTIPPVAIHYGLVYWRKQPNAPF